MRIITLNVEGLRQAAEKGFFEWLEQQDADVVCLQDLREKDYQLDEPALRPAGWHAYFFDAFE
ncbi:MAG: exodeoxyribonuclease III, partial [Pseudomonadales bacterium]